jgi:hypothetical protein
MNSNTYRRQAQLARSRRLLPTAKVVTPPRPREAMTVYADGHYYPHGVTYDYATGTWH